MALTKVSGPLLHGSNDNLGNYVINNITGAAATFTGNVSIGGTLTYDDVTNVESVGIVTAKGGLHVGAGGTIIHALSSNNGSVGIGSTIPNGVLTLYHPTNNTILNVKSGDAGAVINITDNNARSSIEQNGTTLKIIADTDGSDADSQIRFQVDGGTKMRVNSDGEVQIGTTSDPTADIKLLVSGNGGVSSGSYFSFRGDYGNVPEPAAYAIKFDSSIFSSAGLHQYAYGGIAFNLGGQDRVNFTQAGSIGIGTTNPGTQLHLYGSTPILRLTDTDTSGPIHTNIDGASGYLTLDVGSVHRDVIITSAGQANEIARFTGDGLVGIATATPPDWCRFSVDHGQYGLTRFSNHSHLLLQNKNAGTTDFWSLAPRDNGSISMVRGTTDTNGTVDGANARFAISSAGRVGVGSDASNVISFFEANYTSGTVAYPFDVERNHAQSYSPYDHEVTIKNNTNGTEDNFCGIFFRPGAHSDGNRISCARISAIDKGDYRADLTFGTRGYRGGNTRFQEVLRLDSNGHASLTTGNLSFANGSGIDFSATSGGNASSGIFHDYEEGLWTPTVVSGIDGTGTFSIVRGWYIKVGDLVQISFFVRFVNNATGSTGNGNHFKMGGLPYAAADLTAAYSSGGVVTYTNCYFNNSNTIVFSIYDATTQMEFHSARAAAANLGSDVNNNRDIYGVGTYRSA